MMGGCPVADILPADPLPQFPGRTTETQIPNKPRNGDDTRAQEQIDAPQSTWEERQQELCMHPGIREVLGHM